MKKYLIFAILVIAVVAGVFLSCNREPEMPTEVTMQNVLNVVMRYYPYEEGDVLTFKNENTGETLSLAAKSSDNDNFLQARTDTIKYKEGKDTPVTIVGWSIGVSARLTEKQSGGVSAIHSNISADTEERQRVFILWNVGLYKNGYNRGDVLFDGNLSEVYAYFTDTIKLTMRDVILDNQRKDLPENAYLYVVRDTGITEFSLDGQTVWKRVD